MNFVLRSGRGEEAYHPGLYLGMNSTSSALFIFSAEVQTCTDIFLL
jgi:hypothetical protein